MRSAVVLLAFGAVWTGKDGAVWTGKDGAVWTGKDDSAWTGKDDSARDPTQPEPAFVVRLEGR